MNTYSWWLIFFFFFFLDKLEWDAFYMLFHLRLVKGISIVCPIFYMLAKDRKNWKYRR